MDSEYIELKNDYRNKLFEILNKKYKYKKLNIPLQENDINIIKNIIASYYNMPIDNFKVKKYDEDEDNGIFIIHNLDINFNEDKPNICKILNILTNKKWEYTVGYGFGPMGGYAYGFTYEKSSL